MALSVVAATNNVAINDQLFKAQQCDTVIVKIFRISFSSPNLFGLCIFNKIAIIINFQRFADWPIIEIALSVLSRLTFSVFNANLN